MNDSACSSSSSSSVPVNKVRFRLPFAGLDPRTAWIRGTLLVACLLGLIICAPVWLNTRSVPLLPILNGFPVLPSPLDRCLLGAMLASLVIAFWFYRPAVIFFLAASFFAYCQDENRGQPWLYMYWVTLLLTLCPGPAAVPACRLAISIAYVWGGIQKLQPAFFTRVPDFFVSPAATKWHLPAVIVQTLSWCVACAPAFEFFIGVFLWTARFRNAAIFAALLVHLTALVFLGPFGRDYNAVIWPWNVAMIAMILALFGWTSRASSSGARGGAAPVSSLSIWQNLQALRQSWAAMAIIVLYGLLPLLSYIGMWDSYFSFTLYADNQAKADIFVSEAFANRLPPEMRAHVLRLRQDYNPEFQGPYVFEFQGWGMQELSVPPLQEPRNFLRIFKYLGRFSRESGDLRMNVRPRYGPTVFYQGDFHFIIPPDQ
jgi:hypothetical protein